MLKTIQAWFDNRFKSGTPSKNGESDRSSLLPSHLLLAHVSSRADSAFGSLVNTMAAFLTLAYLYEITGEKSYLAYLDSWAEWAVNDLPRTTEGG